MPEDLIEEAARLFGYDKIPVRELKGELRAAPAHDDGEINHVLREVFSGLGYHEIISYSFVDKKLQSLLDPAESPQEVINPITADMSVMRTNLWPGLINTLLYNTSRQQHRVKIFELGTCFIGKGRQLTQPARVAGLISGLAEREQWGIPARVADFFDMKGDLLNLFNKLGFLSGAEFKPASHPALHPGQTADIHISGQKIGIIGKLHPSLNQSLDMSSDVYLFELNVSALKQPALPRLEDISRFPEIRRDIAILVNETVPAEEIQGTIIRSAGPWLKEVFIFDLYQGKGIAPGFKSVALGLILQDPMRTLVDDEVAALIERVVTALKGQLGAELRS